MPPIAPLLPDASRVLAVYAHPDDGDFGAGGTLARLAREGTRVVMAFVTAGGEGAAAEVRPQELELARENEQRRAGAALGVAEVRFLRGYSDGDVRVSRELVRDIAREIRRAQPQVVLTTTLERNWEDISASHPDHLATGEAVMRAVYPAARNPLAFPELLQAGLRPWVVDEVWLQWHPRCDHVVGFEEQDMNRKITALKAHRTQFSDPEDIAARARRESAAAAAGTTHPFAERFFRAATRGWD